MRNSPKVASLGWCDVRDQLERWVAFSGSDWLILAWANSWAWVHCCTRKETYRYFTFNASSEQQIQTEPTKKWKWTTGGKGTGNRFRRCSDHFSSILSKRNLSDVVCTASRETEQKAFDAYNLNVVGPHVFLLPRRRTEVHFRYFDSLYSLARIR